MQLAYLDESYNSAYYWMVAVLVDCDRAKDLEDSLNESIRSSCGKHLGWVPAGIEYHGYELFHGEKEWAPLKSKPRARISIYADALRALAAGGVQVILRGVDRKAHAARYSDPWGAHEVVLWHLMERIELFAAQAGPPVLVIADEIADPDLYRKAGRAMAQERHPRVQVHEAAERHRHDPLRPVDRRPVRPGR